MYDLWLLKMFNHKLSLGNRILKNSSCCKNFGGTFVCFVFFQDKVSVYVALAVLDLPGPVWP